MKNKQAPILFFKRLLLWVFLLCNATLMLAQQKGSKRLERANLLFDNYSYVQAIAEYEKLLKKNNIAEAQLKLAECYRLTRQMDNAEKWYRKAAENNAIDSVYLYRFAFVLKYNKKYEEAKNWYLKYEGVKKDGSGAKQARFLEMIHFFVRDSSKVDIKNMAFNSDNADFSPAFFEDGLIFSSSRTKGKNPGGLDQWTGENFNDLYFIAKVNVDSASKTQILKGFINSNFHEGPLSYDKQTKTIYFSRNSVEKGLQKRSKDGTLKVQIYTAKLQDNRWDVIENFSLNNSEFVFCHPSITADGNRIYFASDMMGGLGGLDIYYAEKSGNGWGSPVNLGSEINTPWNDAFPYIHTTGTLYFASEGLPGLGGFDVYSVRYDGSNWTDVKNLGYPINTSKDDFGFILDSTNKSGYISSNRDGGKGNDDIYSVFIKESYFEEGVLLSVEEDSTKKDEVIEVNDFDMLQPATENNIANTAKQDSIAGLPVNSLNDSMEEALAQKLFKPDYSQEEELAKKVMKSENNVNTNTVKNEQVSNISTTNKNKVSEENNNLNNNTIATSNNNKTNNTINNNSNNSTTNSNTEISKPIIAISEKTKKQVVNMKDAKGRLMLEKADYATKSKNVNGLTYRVQVGAYAMPLKKSPDVFFKTKVETYSMGDNITRYVTPLFFNNIIAATEHKKLMIEKGIKDAWIVPFYNNKRISVEEAIELLNQ